MVLYGNYILVYFSIFWLCNDFDFSCYCFDYFGIMFWLFCFGYCVVSFGFSNGYVLGFGFGVWLGCLVGCG